MLTRSLPNELTTRMPPLLIWMNQPSHYQADFFSAIREAGIDLVVFYYGSVTPRRRHLGWSMPDRLPDGEWLVKPTPESILLCSDWRERTHIVLRSYTSRFIRALSRLLSRNRVPWVGWGEPTAPGWRWWATYPLKRWYAGMVRHHALGVFAMGDMAKRDFVRWGMDPSRIALLPYTESGLPVHAERDVAVASFAANHNPVFLFVGELNRRKGVDILLTAFAALVSHVPWAGLILVGNDTSGGAYQRMAERLRLGQNAFFRGPVPSAHIASVVLPADVVVLPSRFDGWGIVLNEAASLGKALIATESCGAAHHLIRNGHNGLRIPPTDVPALHRAMSMYASQQPLIAEHGLRSRVLFEQYAPEANVDRLVRAFGDWTGQTRNGGSLLPVE